MPKRLIPFDPGVKPQGSGFNKATQALQQWLAETLPRYRRSREYRSLSPAHQESKGSWFSLFMELNLMYFSGRLRDIDADTVDEILIDLLPRKLIVPADQVESIIPELLACWQWLQRLCVGSQALEHADAVIGRLHELEANYPAIFSGDKPSSAKLQEVQAVDQGESDHDWIRGLIAVAMSKVEDNEDDFAPPQEWLVLHSDRPFSQFLSYVMNHEFDTDTSVEAVEVLLRFALQNLQMRLRQKEPSAHKFWGDCETSLISTAAASVPSSMALVLNSLASLRHYLSDEFIEFVQEWHRQHAMEVTEGPDLSADSLRDGLLELLADADDEFLFLSLIKDQLAFLPPDAMNALMSSILDINEPTISDAVTLLILDNDSGAASSVAELLALRPNDISATSLGRLIRVRNWLSSDVQSSIDQAIRKARRLGTAPVDSGLAESSDLIEAYATGIDGVGAQGIMLLIRCGRRFRLISLVLKEDIGVVDTIVSPMETRSYLQQSIKQARAATGTMNNIDPTLIREQLPIFLRLNRQSAINLDHELIQALELIGLKDWNPSEEPLSSLLPEQLNQEPTTAELAASKTRSARWTRNSIGSCWFEEIDFLDAILAQPVEQMVATVCREQLEPMRSIWLERLQRMALWAHHAGNQTRRKQARDFAVVAWMLEQGQAMESIPLMRSIAELSIQIGCEQALPGLR